MFQFPVSMFIWLLLLIFKKSYFLRNLSNMEVDYSEFDLDNLDIISLGEGFNEQDFVLDELWVFNIIDSFRIEVGSILILNRYM